MFARLDTRCLVSKPAGKAGANSVSSTAIDIFLAYNFSISSRDFPPVSGTTRMMNTIARTRMEAKSQNAPYDPMESY